MKLALYNGSPRGINSNTKILLEKFITGYNQENYSISYLNKPEKNEDHKNEYINSEYIIIGFPLYTDSMPGIVKFFIESLQHHSFPDRKKIGFVVQSGFPEAIHSVYVERYLEKLSERLNAEYLGTIIKGGCEGIKLQPPIMTKKLFQAFYNLGEHFSSTFQFDPLIIKKLRKPYKFNPLAIIIFRFLSLFGVTDLYWNMNLKKNNAYKHRYAQPYQ